MLARCLESLAAQIIPDDIVVSLVVVDNDPAASARLVVAQFAARAPFQVYYVHEPRRGIAQARNAALGKAVELGADWIAMLDDDERAQPDWLAMLMAPEYRNTPILYGLNFYLNPPGSRWAIPSTKVEFREGVACKVACTGNVRFSADLVVHAGLSFDESLGLTGGEDVDFFVRARQAGYEIRRTRRAVTIEHLPPERVTYAAQVYRAYWCSAADMRRMKRDYGLGPALLRKLHTVPGGMIAGAAYAVAAGAVWMFSGELYRRYALRAGKDVAKSCGRAAAMLGITPQPYRTIHGA